MEKAVHLSSSIFFPGNLRRRVRNAIGMAGSLYLGTIAGAERPSVTLSMPIAIEDSALKRFAGNVVDSAGTIRACLKAGAPHTLLVFCNGTQAGELDSAETEKVLSRHPDLRQRPGGAKGGAAAPGTLGSWLYGKRTFIGTLLDNAMDARQKLLRIAGMGAWPCGITIENRIDAAASRDVVGRDIVHCTVLGRLYFVYAGIGYHGAAFIGPLTDTLQADKRNHFDNNSFSLSVGLPFIRYEMQTGAPVLPYYFWLENDIRMVMDHAEQGKTLARAEWRWDRTYLDNRAHVFYFRAGHFAADLLFDRYVYRQGILRLSVERLPSILGTWGVSFTRAADTWIPGIWLEFPQIASRGFSAGGYRFPVASMPLRIHFDYYEPYRFAIGCTMNILIGCRKNTLTGSAPGAGK